MRSIVTVHTVEDFFAMLHFLKPANSVRLFARFHFFEEGVFPMWEDSANKEGGILWLEVAVEPKGNSETSLEINTLWTNLLMSLVGETLEDPSSTAKNDITGVVLSKKRDRNRLGIWVRDAKDTEAIERIKAALADILPSADKLTFTPHGEGKK